MMTAGRYRRCAAFAIAAAGAALVFALSGSRALCAEAQGSGGRLAAPKPPEYTAQDEKALNAAKDKLTEIRGRLMNEKLSVDEANRLAQEGVPLALMVRTLEAKKKAWADYQRSQGVPIGAAPQLPKLYEALFDYQKLYRRQFRLTQADGMSPGPEPLGGEWEAVADRFEPFTRLPMTVGRSGTARYAMRALLVRGQALLYASVAYYRKKETAKQLDCYAKGCAALEAVSHPAEEGAIGTAWLEREQMLEMPEQPYSGAELIGAHDPSLYPAVRQVESSVRARQALAEFCPWGVKTYAALAEYGILRGLDWRILEPYTDPNAEPGESTSWPDRSLLDYFTGYGRKYFWEHTMGWGPSSIDTDFNAFRAGEFEHRGRKIKLKWRNAPKSVTYTVWVVSPMMSGATLSDVVGYVTDAALYLAEGFQAVVIDKLTDAAIAAVDTESEAGIFTSTSTIGEAETGDTVGVTYTARRVGAASAMLAKDNVEAVLGIVEKNEMEVLFESIDPRSDQVRGLVGDPKSYDGSDINPVIIRAYATGWEDTGENRFPRQWHYLRYYEFDARALAGVENYDLSRENVKELPRLKEFLADEPKVQGEAWKLLPDKPKRVGTRLYVTDHSPEMQELELTVDKQTLSQWMLKDTREKGVVATIRIPAPYAGEYLMGPLDPSRDITVGYALVSDRVSADAAFLGKVSWHARQKLPALFRQYQVRILVCKKGRDVLTGNPMYYYNDREAYELASFPVRFTPTKGNPATGRLRSTVAGEAFAGVVAMSQTYGAAPARTVEAPAAGMPLLPRVVAVEAPLMANGVLNARDGQEFAFKAFVSPVEPGDYHATVRIGPYTYHMWARTDRRGGAAVFSGTIPAPPGTNAVTVSCEGAAPAMFTLERNPGAPSFEWANGRLAEAQQGVSSARDAQSQRWATITFWDAHVDMAGELIKAAQYDQAKQYAGAVLQQGPQALAFGDDTGITSRWMAIREHAAEHLLEAAYHSGDGATAAAAAQAYVKESTDRILYENAHDMHGALTVADHPLYISNNYARAMRKAIAAGADAGVIAALEQEYISWRQKTGGKYLQYDRGIFLYGGTGGTQ